MKLVLLGLAILGATVVLFHAVFTIGRMTMKTNHGIRAAYWFMAFGCLAELFMVANGELPGTADSLFVIGAGLVVIFDRRQVGRTERITHAN